jgi:nitrogen fixation NifU-like protein
MSELEELYQEIIMQHNRRPRNFRSIEGADRSANGFNPFCGDTITLYLNMGDDVITDVGFQGSGCAISRASASMMTESIKGKTSDEARKIFDEFHQMITRGPNEDFESDSLGDLDLLSGVAKFPPRIKCATLSWHTLLAALKGQEGTVKTE